jgi:hypothetical protein
MFRAVRCGSSSAVDSQRGDAAGTCGGADKLDCFRAVATTLRTAYDAMLTEIDGLRVGRPTAVRMVTGSNEFLTDAELIGLLGADFGKTRAGLDELTP